MKRKVIKRKEMREGQSQVILLDNHVVLWLTSDPAQLPGNSKAAIKEARKRGDGSAISDITLLGLATLANEGGLRLNISLESFLQAVEARCAILPISGRACAPTRELPGVYQKVRPIAASELPHWLRGYHC